MNRARAADAAVDRSDALARASRTALGLASIDERWALPWWLDRQRRAGHAAFVPSGDTGLVENLTGRSWTTLATTSSGPLALVDPAGAVQPVGASWSVDWAIGAEDRWHRPAVETTVRRRTVAQAPVVETLCRVPSGDAIARAYAIAGGADGDAVVLEIENDSPVPFVALVSVRPVHALGFGEVTSLRVDHPHVLVDERPVLVLDPRTSHHVLADAPDDALVLATDGRATPDAAPAVRSAGGLATGAFLVPVPHRTAVRFLLFPHAPRRARPVRPTTLPTAGQVARGWESHTAAAARVELPDRRLSEAYLLAVRSIVAAASGGFPTPVGRERTWGVAEEAAVLDALVSLGLGAVAAPLLRRRGDEVALDSWYRREPASIARNVAMFEAVGGHWALTRDRGVVDDVLGGVVKAAHWTERARARDAALPAALARRAARALTAVAAALRDAGQPDAGADLDAFAARFVLDLDDAPAPAAAGPRPDATAADAGAGEDTAADADEVAVVGPAGADVVATARLARAEVAARDLRAFDRVAWLVQATAATSRWPTHLHPRLGTGSAGSGDDPAAAAAFASLVRALVVDEDAEPGGLALLPVVPAHWYGQSIDVRDLPTRAGRLSFALRWHATRPALLWELEPHDPSVPVRLTVPGLDPTWSSVAHAGETLLGTPPLAGVVPVAEHPDTDHVPMTTLEPRIRRAAPGNVVAPAPPEAPPTEPGDSFA